MKIHTQQTTKYDELNLSGNILTINGTDYDLNNLSTLEEGQSPEDIRCYLENDIPVIFLKVNHELSFMFTKTKHMLDGKKELVSNLLCFYDINDDDDISLDEFAVIVDHWNMEEKNRLAARKVIYDNFRKTGSVEDWLKKGVNKKGPV